MPTDELKFDIQEKPSWRSGEKTTSSLFKDILIWKGNFDRLSQQDQSSFKDAFTLCMNIEYVYQSNIAENIGVQTYEGTKDVLERNVHVGVAGAKENSKEEKETVNTAKAYMALRAAHQAMQTTGKLTIDVVCKLHKELMSELRVDAGSIRKIDAYNRLPDDSLYFYTKPDVAKPKLISLLHQHNIHMEIYAKSGKEWIPGEQYIYLCKCAAWLMFHFMEIHPFSDGNGRLGWLLVNYIISLINPFPVHLYSINKFSAQERQTHFREALNACRKNPKDGPKDLAALFVEGLWCGWSKCTRAQEMRLNASSSITLIIQKSKVGEIDSRVRESGISGYLGVNESEAIANVREIVDRIDVGKSQGHQYTQIKIEGSTTPSIFVRVFP
jgi:Fic family protein